MSSMSFWPGAFNLFEEILESSISEGAVEPFNPSEG